MKLKDLIAFLSNYDDLMDAEIEIEAIMLGCRQENLVIEDKTKDWFGGTIGEVVLRADNCFDGKSDDDSRNS